MKEQLVQFGNFLFSTYKVKDKRGDIRQVGGWDLANFEYDAAQNPATERFNLGEKVKVFLMPEGEESFPGFIGHITGIHYFYNKVKYDLEINFAGEISTRIYNIDEVLVSKA